MKLYLLKFNCDLEALENIRETFIFFHMSCADAIHITRNDKTILDTRARDIGAVTLAHHEPKLTTNDKI